MEIESIYKIKSEKEVILPASLKDSFLDFVSNNGVQFAPQIREESESALFTFLFLTISLKELVEFYLATFVPDDFWATEIAVPNDRVKHVERLASDSQWIPYIRQRGGQKTRLCFIRTPRSVPVTELEERIELVV